MKQTLIVLLGVCVLFFNCKKPPYCGESTGLQSSSLGLTIFNTATNEYTYPENETLSPFKRDSLQVFNEDGRKFNFVNFGLAQDPRNPSARYYGVKISPAFIIPDDNDAFDQEKSRRIYLQYNYCTRDTLTLTFKAYKDRCDNGQYEYLKVYHRGNLIATATKTYYAVFTVNH